MSARLYPGSVPNITTAKHRLAVQVVNAARRLERIASHSVTLGMPAQAASIGKLAYKLRALAKDVHQRADKQRSNRGRWRGER